MSSPTRNSVLQSWSQALSETQVGERGKEYLSHDSSPWHKKRLGQQQSGESTFPELSISTSSCLIILWLEIRPGGWPKDSAVPADSKRALRMKRTHTNLDFLANVNKRHSHFSLYEKVSTETMFPGSPEHVKDWRGLRNADLPAWLQTHKWAQNDLSLSRKEYLAALR